MNELDQNISAFISSLTPSHSLPLFILALFGIFLTIITLFFFLYFSVHRFNNHFILPNLLICFSVCFMYTIVIFFLIRGNELFCGLREFLSQVAYALLFSALLCRDIMQWLSTRILSKRTKQLTSLLLYFLLVFTQIPIGLLWWYFTVPRFCPHPPIHDHPKFKFHFRKRISTERACAYQCIVDDRFYATYSYIIFELFLCTIIAIGFFFYRCCHRSDDNSDQFTQINNNHQTFSTFLNMSALIFMDVAWLFWTFIYHFTHTVYVFPALVIGMFSIGTIALVLILLPQIYFYSKNQIKDILIPKSLLFSNQFASMEDIKDQDLLLSNKQTDSMNQNTQQIVYNGSELSYELGTSGTFLPITRTPKGLFNATSIKNIDQVIYGEGPDTTVITNNHTRSIKNERKRSPTETEVTKASSVIAPLQRQLTPNSAATNFVNSSPKTEHFPRSNTSMYYSSCIPSYHDETLIPILCNTQHHSTSTPVKMRILIKSPSSSVPTARRVYSGADHRYIQQNSYSHFPPALSTAPLYYSPSLQQKYAFVHPNRPMPSYSGGNLCRVGSPSSHGYLYPYRRIQTDQRSLSQRLWDIDSGDDQDEMEGQYISRIPERLTPSKERLENLRLSHLRKGNHGGNLYDSRKPVFI